MKVSSKQQGFTMIELMITLVIMSILVAMAAPSFNGLIHNSRVDTTANGLLIGLNTARNEAIKRGTSVSVCAGNAAVTACGANWAQGWLVFTGTAFNAGNIVTISKGDASTTTVGGTAPAQISFTSRGIIDTTVPPPGVGTLIVNATQCKSGIDRQITVTINSAGRVIPTRGTCP